MTNKPFLRESNIWRLLGLGIAFIGILFAVLFPDLLVYDNHGFKVSLGVVIMTLGFLGFYPTLKEAFAKKVSK
jgi:hypothetical protein